MESLKRKPVTTTLEQKVQKDFFDPATQRLTEDVRESVIKALEQLLRIIEILLKNSKEFQQKTVGQGSR